MTHSLRHMQIGPNMSHLKSCTFTWSPSSRSCLSNHTWPSVYTQLIISLLFLYDLMHHQSSISFDDYFNSNNTRSAHSRSLMTKSSVITAYCFSFFVKIVSLCLPAFVCNLKSHEVSVSFCCT